jgi:DNA-binding MurR/RpiR family transcriptional regulator
MPTSRKFKLTDDPTTWMQHLSPRHQEIIQQVMQHPREYVLLSVRAAAERLGTDPATMVRIIQRMGFENYRAFQNYLHGLSIARFTDEFFVASVESESFLDSYVAPMALINLILVACAYVDRDATMLRLREAAKEQREGFRWYEKS